MMPVLRLPNDFNYDQNSPLLPVMPSPDRNGHTRTPAEQRRFLSEILSQAIAIAEDSSTVDFGGDECWFNHHRPNHHDHSDNTDQGAPQ